jgi:micrococcal nuclease
VRHRGVLVTSLAVALLPLAACGPVTASGRSPSPSTTAIGAAPGSPIASSSAPLVAAPTGPVGDVVRDAFVTRVVDGDTLHVDVDGADVTVRLLNVDTPETVKPGTPVQCYGPESSDFAKQQLDGQRVVLEYDSVQGRTDRYGRTLAYVWIERADGSLDLFNLASVSGGFAEERTYSETAGTWSAILSTAEERARAAGIGRWSACPN